MTTNNPQHSVNKSRVSISHLEADINSINKNQLNNSSAKMQYSFPKSSRFDQKQKSISPPKFYDLPDIKSKRATTLGYGNKLDLSKRNFITPAPNNYTLKSDFEKQQKQGITMSPGRQVIRTNSVFANMHLKLPGPSNYSPGSYNLSHSFSIRKKIEDQSAKWINSVPGPGNYGHIELINKDCKIPIAKFESCPSTRFGKYERKGLGQEKLRIPGVGQCNGVIIIDNIEHQLIAGTKMTHRGSKFGKSQRKPLDYKSFHTPGPGTYNKFSEFLH